MLGVAPVHPLCAAVPDRADALPGRRRLPATPRRQLHARQHRRPRHAADPRRRSGFRSAFPPRPPSSARLIGLAIALAIIRGRLPGWHPLHGDDLFRRRLQLRRHPAGLRLPRHARPARPCHGAAQDGVRLRHLPRRLQPPELLGPDAHLPLLPDPADDPDHRAGDRRAEAGVERGRRDAGRHQLASSGAMSACRCCGRTCSARCRCSLPMPSAPSPPPMR